MENVFPAIVLLLHLGHIMVYSICVPSTSSFAIRYLVYRNLGCGPPNFDPYESRKQTVFYRAVMLNYKLHS